MSSIPVFDISNPLGGLLDQAVSMGYVNEKRTTTKGAIASFDDNIEHAVSIKADIDPTLDGVSAVNVTIAGKNLFDEDNLIIDNVPYSSMIFSKSVYLPVGTYKASISNIKNAANWRFGFRAFSADGNIITNAITNGYISTDPVMSDTFSSNTTMLEAVNGTTTNVTINILKPCNLACCISSGNVGSSTTLNYQIEKGSTATAYEPYAGDTATISLGSTVYGGSVSISEEGEVELTKTWDGVVDLSSLTWTLDSNTNRARSHDLNSVIYIPSGASVTPDALAENFDIVNYNSSLSLGKMTIYSDGSLIAYYDGENAPSGKFAYKLATTTTSTLTPITPIETLEGENNIWADTGDIEVGYFYQLYQPI